MKKILSVFFVFALLSLSASDLDLFKGKTGVLNIAGGTAHIKCEKEAIKNIMKQYPDITISIAGGGSGVGIKQVSSKIIDLANSGRMPTAKEIKNGNLKIYRFAIDGIGVVVNPNRKLSSLSTKQLQDIFSGKIKNFNELGFKEGKINLYTRDEASATRKVFWKKALEKSKISNRARVVSSNSSMKTAVANDKNAIGIISIGVADKSVKLLNINNVKPTVKNIDSKKYKVARGLYLLSNGEPKSLAKAYIQYLRSEDGAKIVNKYGFIPVNE